MWKYMANRGKAKNYISIFPFTATEKGVTNQI